MMYSGFVPLKLSTFWDHININLPKVTNELFGAKYVETAKIKVSVPRLHRLQLQLLAHTNSLYLLTHFCSFFLQIHPNCRIRGVYFTDRLYSHKELPSDIKRKISEESTGAPSVAPDKSATSEPDQGAALQTTSGGRDYMRGIQSILNSIEREPLRLWKKEVSVYKTISSLKSAGLVLVLQTFPIINITTSVCSTLIISNLYHG